MLPGFRFLFAAIMLSSSMLIFGLGAAALLRAAHGEFASIPSRRAPPETMFAQPGDASPALAMLRVESSVADEKPENPTTSDNVPIAAPPPEQAAVASAAPDPEKGAAEPDGIAAPTDVASTAENPSPSSVHKEASTPEIPAPADAPSPAAETKVAAIAELTPIAPNETPVTTPDQAAVPVDDSTGKAETRIASLGGPAVTIETKMPSKMVPAIIKKSAQAKRAIKRRKIAQRPRVARPSPPQRPANPFGTPFGS